MPLDLQSNRTRVRRIPKRGSYDRETINEILDAAFLCHMGFVVDGQPYVIPTLFGRDGDRLYVHGSSASRMLRALSADAQLCVTVTLVDGLVLARSAFHHSMNYRSVVILGQGTAVEDPEQKAAALRVIAEHLLPGRWDEVRPPNEQELEATLVMGIPIEEASAKVRTGPPLDDEADYALPVWAGVVPIVQVAQSPVRDEAWSPEGIETPRSVRDYVERGGRR